MSEFNNHAAMVWLAQRGSRSLDRGWSRLCAALASASVLHIDSTLNQSQSLEVMTHMWASRSSLSIRSLPRPAAVMTGISFPRCLHFACTCTTTVNTDGGVLDT